MRGEINLLPIEYRQKPVANREQIVLAILIMCSLFYMAYFGFGVFGVERANLKQAINQATAELDSLQESVQKYEMKLAQKRVMTTNKDLANTLEKDILPAAPLLTEMNKIIPSGVVLKIAETGENGSLVLKGTCNSWSKVADFVDRINQSAYYAEARVMEKKEIAEKQLWDFEVHCFWQKGGAKQ